MGPGPRRDLPRRTQAHHLTHSASPARPAPVHDRDAHLPTNPRPERTPVVSDTDQTVERSPQTRGVRTPPKLTSGEQYLLRVTVVLLLAVGSIGLFVSFKSVSEKAAAWGFSTPELLPVAIDLAIPGFTVAHLLLVRMDMELAWVRAVPWALTAVTVYLNIQAGVGPAAKIGHGALPLVWVVCSEIAGHVYRALIGEVTGRRMERIRRSRMVMSPLQTLGLWRRMILWEETSYLTALGRERARLLTRADLRERYGRRWRWKAPIRERALLRLGELAPSAHTERVSVSAVVERERQGAQPEALTTESVSVYVPERPALTTASVSALAEETLTETLTEAGTTLSAERAHLAHASAVPERERPLKVSADSGALSVSADGERRDMSVTNTSVQPERVSVSAAERAHDERVTASATAKPRGAKVSALADARSLVVLPLYETLNRRPEWTEIRDALIAAGHEEVSRPTAQRIRGLVEEKNPKLARYTETSPELAADAR